MKGTTFLWVVAIAFAGLAICSLAVGGGLGWIVGALYGYFAFDMARFALRLRRLRREFDRSLDGTP